ncbi:unnamed protein product [Schistosoma rodhaini]|uniref:PSP domain-containing protein n=1 Tax=Schistosoma mansoni TaxID=6183 RepID=A0A5K4F736_SCHMA|nr:unnamed protein product [Schistosoma rodhaini]
MTDNQDDIFVIDKCGSSLDDKQPDITYDFTELEEESLTTSSQNPRSRKPVYGKRYHEADFDNKYRPGRISRELRKALNLSSHDIPIHIYRMRTLGYPPGWLKKAAVGGCLLMFDSDNTDSLESEREENKQMLRYTVKSSSFSSPLLISLHVRWNQVLNLINRKFEPYIISFLLESLCIRSRILSRSLFVFLISFV